MIWDRESAERRAEQGPTQHSGMGERGFERRAGPDPFTPVKRLADYAELFPPALRSF
jgi:hypothetical protein